MSTDITDGIAPEAKAIHAAFDATGVKFNDRASALEAFRADGRDIVFDEETGQPFTKYDGELMPLSNALLRFGYDRREFVDGRSLPREGIGTSRPGTLSKADFPDVKSKVAFINERGEDAWLRLPLTSPVTSEVLTHADWYRLPRSERVRLTNIDPDAFSKLKPSPNQPQPGQARINQVALDKIAAIRPASRKR